MSELTSIEIPPLVHASHPTSATDVSKLVLPLRVPLMLRHLNRISKVLVERFTDHLSLGVLCEGILGTRICCLTQSFSHGLEQARPHLIPVPHQPVVHMALLDVGADPVIHMLNCRVTARQVPCWLVLLEHGETIFVGKGERCLVQSALGLSQLHRMGPACPQGSLACRELLNFFL